MFNKASFGLFGKHVSLPGVTPKETDDDLLWLQSLSSPHQEANCSYLQRKTDTYDN